MSFIYELNEAYKKAIANKELDDEIKERALNHAKAGVGKFIIRSESQIIVTKGVGRIYNSLDRIGLKYKREHNGDIVVYGWS